MMQSTKGKVAPGDVFYAIWGYDETHYDFVAVESVSASGKSVMCRMCKKVQTEEQDAAPVYRGVKPGVPYGEPFRLMVRTTKGGEVCLRGSYPFVPGGKRVGWFFPAEDRDRFSETDPLFGH